MATKPASGTTPASRAAAKAAGQPTTYTARKNAGLISGSSGPNLIDASKRVVESKDSQIESITSQAQQIQGAINKLSTETPENIAELAQTPQPQGQPGAPTVPFAQAQQALRSGGAFSGQALTNAENSLADTYRKAGMLANQSGVPAPQGQGAGASGAQQFTGAVTVAPETPSILGGVQEVDSMFDSLFVQFDDFYSPVKQKTSLVEEYNKMRGSLGIDAINAELIDAKRIIEGTEDDIRAEVTATGGMATESQVLALANARNKSLIKNYNYLLDTKNAAMEQLGTMMQLTIADREAAAKEFDTKMNFAFKVAEFKERATTNARTGLQNYITTITDLGGNGYATLYEATNGSAYEAGLIEKTLGMPKGSLAQAALLGGGKDKKYQSVVGKDGQLYTFDPSTGIYEASGMGVDPEEDINTTITEVGGRKFVINEDTGEIINEVEAPKVRNELQEEAAKETITKLDTLLSHQGLAGSVGANPFARSSLDFNWATGVRQDFIAGVEQLVSEFTIDKLIQAKASGATFGALSEKELGLLAASASKIGTWAIRDDSGKVTGYDASEKSFKAELENIKRLTNKALEDSMKADDEYQSLFDGASPEQLRELDITAANRPTRNNNPLNIKYSPATKTYPGVKGVDPIDALDGGKFLSFTSPQAGFKAAERLITSENYKNLSVDAALKRWSNKGYGGEIIPELKSKKISQLTPRELAKLLKVMARKEGYNA